MARRQRWIAYATAVAMVTVAAEHSDDAGITSVRVASGLDRPVFATAPAGDSERLFIIEQHSGRIRILGLASNELHSGDFLVIDGVADGTEQGLLGLAFHPNYAQNGFFFVNLTIADGTTEIRRYRVSADPDVADPQSAQLVLRYGQPQSNHNGGWIGFDADGWLHISTGDGGGANDSSSGHTPGTGNAQDLTDNLLGKLLRISVDGDDFPDDDGRNYSIPPSNPFVDTIGDDEIWSYGLRNPWRASFDRATRDLYIGDVGQGAREEINVQPAGSGGGQNYGWRLREGTIATPGAGGDRPAGAIDPIHDYTHGSATFEGRSVTGGYVYRGPIAEIRGHYFFADYASARIWSLVYDGSAPSGFDGSNFTNLVDRTAELAPGGGMSISEISSFAEDDAGNLYILDLEGEIFRVVAAPATTTTTTTTLPGTGTCGDPIGMGEFAACESSIITASDALFVLRASVGNEACVLCVCDANGSGTVTASDALAVLQAAVDAQTMLACPPC